MENPSKRLKSINPLPYLERLADIPEDYNFNSAIIVQINNCVSRKLHMHSFCWNLTQYFPYANPYTHRKAGPYGNLTHVLFRPSPGTINIAIPKPGCTGPSIACCFSQYRMGHSQSTYYMYCKNTDEEYRVMSLTKDSYSHRLEYFDKCLNILTEKLLCMSNIKIVVFPRYIGCGMAGGNWYDYEIIISRFCFELKIVRPDIVVHIVERKSLNVKK